MNMSSFKTKKKKKKTFHDSEFQIKLTKLQQYNKKTFLGFIIFRVTQSIVPVSQQQNLSLT